MTFKSVRTNSSRFSRSSDNLILTLERQPVDDPLPGLACDLSFVSALGDQNRGDACRSGANRTAGNDRRGPKGCNHCDRHNDHNCNCHRLTSADFGALAAVGTFGNVVVEADTACFTSLE